MYLDNACHHRAKFRIVSGRSDCRTRLCFPPSHALHPTRSGGCGVFCTVM